jgi:hypothetical protein
VGAAGASDDHATSDEVTVLVPHARGFASAACGPPSNVIRNDVNGICGASSNAAVSRPVAGSTRIWPCSLIVTPPPRASTRILNISPDAGSDDRGVPTWTPPVRRSASNGVSIATPPIRDAAGQVAAAADRSANCSSAHPTRPPADAGEIVTPSGIVTVASRSTGVARPSASPLCGSRSSTA